MTEISPYLLDAATRNGVTWFAVGRRASTRAELDAYSYGNTVVFSPFGDEGIYVAAVVKGSEEFQVGRWLSGLWAVERADDFATAEQLAASEIFPLVSR